MERGMLASYANITELTATKRQRFKVLDHDARALGQQQAIKPHPVPARTLNLIETYDDLGRLHSANHRAALVSADGSMRWYTHGELDRPDGCPAVVCASGRTEWHVQGRLHRDHDLPAVLESDGSRAYYYNGRLHRANGPARISLACAEWFAHGERHREGDLPAVVYSTGAMEWWLNGTKIACSSGADQLPLHPNDLVP
jgi:hypothetical protein